MTTSLTTLRTRLAEAEEALHQLLLGQSVVALSHTIVGTNSVQYRPGDEAALERYIAQLEAKIALHTRRGGRRAFYIT